MSHPQRQALENGLESKLPFFRLSSLLNHSTKDFVSLIRYDKLFPELSKKHLLFLHAGDLLRDKGTHVNGM